MNKSFNKTTAILLILLIGTNIIWCVQYASQSGAYGRSQRELSRIVENKKILAFQKMFVDKVLKSNGNVDFATRVELQNAVTDINDADITRVWNTFLSSKNEADGQAAVRDLLSIMADKAYAGREK